MLTGEGADEIFGGYNIFREDKARRFWARKPRFAVAPALLSRLYGYIAARREGAKRSGALFFRNGLENTADPYYSHRIRWQNTAQMKRFFAADLRAQMQSDEAAVRRARGLSRAGSGALASAVPRAVSRDDAVHVVLPAELAGRSHDDGSLRRGPRAVPRSSPDRARRAHSAEVQAARAEREVHPQAELRRHPAGSHREPTEAAVSRADRRLLCERRRRISAASCLQKEALEQNGLVDADAVQRLLQKAGSAGAALGERDEMALATVASLQLLHHQFVDRLSSLRVRGSPRDRMSRRRMRIVVEAARGGRGVQPRHSSAPFPAGSALRCAAAGCVRHLQRLGKDTVIQSGVRITNPDNVSIGSNCNFAQGVFITGGGGVDDRRLGRFRTGREDLVGQSSLRRSGSPLADCRDGTRSRCVIEDDVWLGANVFVMPGVTIGKGAIISAGAVVNKSVPPYGIFAGNPGRVVGWRKQPAAAAPGAPAAGAPRNRSRS